MENATLVPELMKKRDVAAFCQCSQRQVEILTAKGRLPKPIYLGENSPRWKRAELLKHLDGLQAGDEGAAR